jgi:hypothetical protein
MRDQACLLALTPPRHSTVTVAGQAEMLAALAHARRTTAWGVALEIAGAAGHVRFLARAANMAAREQLAMFLSGYFPQGAVVPLRDPADDPACLRAGEGATARELRLRTGSALPLRAHETDEASAQLLRIVGVLRNLPAGTRGLCQLILWPGPRGWTRALGRWLQVERAPLAQRGAAVPDGLPLGLLAGVGLTALAGYGGYHSYQAHDLPRLAALAAEAAGAGALLIARQTVFAPDPPPDPTLVARKLAAPAFTARLRLLVVGGDVQGRAAALDALVAAYSAYEEPQGNGFVARPCAPEYMAAITTQGGPRVWRRPWPILNASEVASLYHLPAADVEVPGLGRTASRTLLPAAAALTTGTRIGTATLGVHSDAVCIPQAAYGANMVVIGATGTGKSTFLQHYAHDAVMREHVQLVVIDPDSSLVRDMVGWLPDEQKLRAVVLDFGHRERAVGLNLLDAYTGRHTDQIVSSIVQAWARYYGEAWGPRLEDLIRYACATILAANRTRPRERQLTLLDVKPLLQIAAFRNRVVQEADDVKLTAYWRDDYLGMPRVERLTAIKPVLTRINRFLLNDATHAIVGQPASTLDIPRLLEGGAPLFIDAAAHTVGEETAALLDAVLLNIIHDTLCERRACGRQVFVVVDEFQHAPALWDQYLPRIRKFGGSYVLAAQGIATIDRVQRDLHKIVVGNTGTHVVFRTPDPDEAAYLAAVLDNAVSAEDLQTLGLRQCYIKTSDATGPLPVASATLPPPPPSSDGTARLIAEACARRYGRPIAEVMAARERWMTELFYATNVERRRESASNGNEVGPADPTAAPRASGQDQSTEETSEAAVLGGQPTLGLPVTRASTHHPQRPRRRRRHTRPSSASPRPAGSSLLDLVPAGMDPLPLPRADSPHTLPLPLDPERA